MNIQDLTEAINGYVLNKDYSFHPMYMDELKFHKEECVAIYIIRKITSDDEEQIGFHILDDPDDEIVISLKEDGYYKVTRIVLPNQYSIDKLLVKFKDNDKYKRLLKNEGQDRYFQMYGNELYYFNSRNKCFYKKIYDAAEDSYYDEKVDPADIFESNPNSYLNLNETKEIFGLCRFRKCVFSRNSEFIKTCPSKCNNIENEDSIHAIMWLNSSLQVFDFLLQCGRYMEAQQLLEMLNVCGGPCAKVSPMKKGGCNCGK